MDDRWIYSQKLFVSLLAAAAAFYGSYTWVRGEAAFEKLELSLRPREAQELFAAGVPGRVMELLRRTEELRPRSPYPCEKVGEVLLRRGDLDGAQQLFERSLSYVPGRPAVYRRLALAACFRGDFESARKHLAQARSLFPADPKNQEKSFFEEFESAQKKAEEYMKGKKL